MKKEYFAEELNGKLVEISHNGVAVQVQLVEPPEGHVGQFIPNVYDVMVSSYNGLMAAVKIFHWYEPEQRYHTEIATCKAQFA